MEKKEAWSLVQSRYSTKIYSFCRFSKSDTKEHRGLGLSSHICYSKRDVKESTSLPALWPGECLLQTDQASTREHAVLGVISKMEGSRGFSTEGLLWLCSVECPQQLRSAWRLQ